MLCHVLKPMPKLCILQLKPGEVLKLSFSAWTTLYQHLPVTSFLHWGANGTVFLWNKVSFSHYSNESKELECTSLRSVPCSQRVTFLPVLVNAGPLVAKWRDRYQPQAEESSVQKKTRKSLAQAVQLFTQWPPNTSQLGINSLLNFPAICLLIALNFLLDFSLFFRLSVVALASLHDYHLCT